MGEPSPTEPKDVLVSLPLAPPSLIAAAVAVAAALLLPAPAAAHADADVVAVAAGDEATINFRPNHGCGASPTTEVAVRVPVAGATGGDVEGWSWTAEADGPDRTIVEWTGGSLPTDVTGAFPVTFPVPDDVGELLLFPAVQTCENGEEWSWLNGDPNSENPVPRLLILAPGAAAATTVEELASDTPGRDLLTAVVDTDVGSEPDPEAAPDTTTTTTALSEVAPGEEGSSGSSIAAFVLVGGVALLMLVGGLYMWRNDK